MKFHNGIYQTGHNEGKLTAEDIDKAAVAAGGDDAADDSNSVSGQIIENNADLPRYYSLRARPALSLCRRKMPAFITLR